MPWRQFDHVLRTNWADDRVVAAVGAEHDAMSGQQGRDIDRIVAIAAIHGDRGEVQAGRSEVTDDLDRIAAISTLIQPTTVIGRHIERVDDDFLDVVQLRNHALDTCDGPGHDDLGISRK